MLRRRHLLHAAAAAARGRNHVLKDGRRTTSLPFQQWRRGKGQGSNCLAPPPKILCRNFFILSENFRPKIQKFGAKSSPFGKNLGTALTFLVPIRSSVGNLLLSVAKSQLSAPPIFLTDDAAAAQPLIPLFIFLFPELLFSNFSFSLLSSLLVLSFPQSN